MKPNIMRLALTVVVSRFGRYAGLAMIQPHFHTLFRGLMLGGIGLVPLLSASCDSKPDPTPETSSADPRAQQPDAPTRPTTQELLNGPRKRVRLNPLPISLEVPVSWEMQTLGKSQITILGGAAPLDDVEISLAQGHTANAAQIEMMEVAARKDMSSANSSIKLFTITDLGKLKVMEKQWLGHPTSSIDIEPIPPAPDSLTAASAATTHSSQRPFFWTITLFAPNGDNYSTYELNFIVTAEQYEADKDFLRGILKTMNYDGE